MAINRDEANSFCRIKENLKDSLDIIDFLPKENRERTKLETETIEKIKIEINTSLQHIRSLLGKSTD